MKLGKLLLLAGAALAANQFLKTEKGKQLKKGVTNKAGEWKEKLTDIMSNGRMGTSESNPTESSYSGGGSPM